MVWVAQPHLVDHLMTANGGEEKKPESDYAVGKGKPPKEHQFKKGFCPNPKGRPKADRNLFTSFEKLLNEPIKANTGKQISNREAMLRVVIKDAMRGDQRAFAHFLRLAKLAGIFVNDSPPIQTGGIVYFHDDPTKPLELSVPEPSVADK